jgi:hypothetical protein
MSVKTICSQATRSTLTLVPRGALLILLCSSMLLLSTVDAHAQATYSQGLPTIGKSTTTAVPGQMIVDAVQFLNPLTAPDMCAAVAAACSTLGTSGYPQGATIDARGFTGDQVCTGNNPTQMLNGCAANGGKLLLGTVHIYADGPTGGVNGHYDDGHSSGVGTPAFIIPNQFWGIEGVSRGSGGNPGTWLSVCTGASTPVTGCHNSFPVRSFMISSTSVSGNTMTITPTSLPTIYLGELLMIKGNSVASNNATYKVQSITPTITVAVPTGTQPCASSSNCGTAFLGTPILGFGPGNGNAYNTSTCSSSNSCAAFGMHIKNLGFDCQGGGTQSSGDIEGCIGWQNLYAQEESGADTFLITNYNFVGFDSHGNNAQNFGPILNAEIYTGDNNSNCDFGTTGGADARCPRNGNPAWALREFR